MLNKLTQNLLLILTLLLAACGLSPAPEEPQLNAAPSALLSSCEIRPCSWNFLGTNPLNPAGSSAISPTMAVDNNGFAVVAYHLAGSGIQVQRFNGSAWVSFGGTIPGTTTSGEDYTLRLDSGNMPLIAYQDASAQIRVGRFNGTSWTFGSNVPCSNPSGVGGFAMDTSGQPVVACNEVNGETETGRIRVNRYNGSTWLPLPIIENAVFPDIVVDANNNIVMAHKDTITDSLNVTRWNGSRWRYLGTVSDQSLAGHDLKLNPQGRPIVVDREMVDGQVRLVVKRWNGRNAFVPIGPAIRDPYTYGSSSLPSLVVQGNLIAVGFAENSLIRVIEFNYSSNSWVQKGSTVNSSSMNPSITPRLAYRPSGEPVVAWGDYDWSTARGSVLVKHWNPTPPAP